jgi:sterol desaturase/sphingolipid hydroxylase (fatty acid hydroxylase superfamily)
MLATVTEPATAGARAGTAPRRRLYLPGAVVALAAGWFAVGGLRALASYPAVMGAIGAERAELIGPVMLGLLAAGLAAERLWPTEARPALARGHVHDTLFLCFYATVVLPLVLLDGVGFASTVRDAAPWLVLGRAAFLPRWLVVVVELVAIDGVNWFVHLANHRWRPLWRFHALHHSQEEMSVLTSFRAHPLVHVSFLVSALPTLVLVSNGAVPAIAFTAYAAYGALVHANVSWGFGPVGRVLVSPAYHRVHHSANGRNDVNLGTVLTVWDLAARRAVFPAADSRPLATGLRYRPVPVEQEGMRRRYGRTFVSQLTEPFMDQTGRDRTGRPQHEIPRAVPQPSIRRTLGSAAAPSG